MKVSVRVGEGIYQAYTAARANLIEIRAGRESGQGGSLKNAETNLQVEYLSQIIRLLEDATELFDAIKRLDP